MEDWITTEEACELSGYHPDHIRELLRERRLKGRKFGPVWQISRKSLFTYLERMKSLGEKRGPKTDPN
jgi:excisionase family DNA binding protein